MIQRMAYISLLVALVGCRQDVPTATSPPTATHKPDCRIERATEAEAVLAQLGQNAWVFRYSGVAMYPELKVTYKAAGKDSAEKSIFDVDRQQTLHIVNARDPSEHETDLSKGGYIIFMFPDSAFSGMQFRLKSTPLQRPVLAAELWSNNRLDCPKANHEFFVIGMFGAYKTNRYRQTNRKPFGIC